MGKAVAFLTAAPLLSEYHHSRNLSPNTAICMATPTICCSLQSRNWHREGMKTPVVQKGVGEGLGMLFYYLLTALVPSTICIVNTIRGRPREISPSINSRAHL